MMKKAYSWGLVSVGLILLIGLALYAWVKSTQHTLVKAQEEANNAWVQMLNQHQSRLDMVPKLVSVVKEIAIHEQNALTMVIVARTKAIQVQQAADTMNEHTIKQVQEAQHELSAALTRLMQATKKYPDLLINQSFIDLKAQFDDSETKVAKEQNRFKEACNSYNSLIINPPTSIVANKFGFSAIPYPR